MPPIAANARVAAALASSVPEGAPLAQKAYVRIRDSIVSLAMTPGSVVDEERLMRELGMSRTPVREAIMRLAQENLVTVLPRRGTFVTEVNIGSLAQLSELRCELEGFAASLAAERAGDDDRAKIAELQSELRSLEGSLDYKQLIMLDRSVHHFVYACARNRFLEEALSRYYYLALRIWFIVLDRVSRLDEAVRDHRQLLRAVGDGRTREAEQIARRHVAGFEREIRKVL